MPSLIEMVFLLFGVAAVVFGVVIAFNVRGVTTRRVERTYRKLELMHQASGRLGPVSVPLFGTAGYLRFLGAVMIPFGLIMIVASVALMSLPG
ncbi:hypothetical protein M1P56_04935 [Streptomyces sp. HU2014]|uniref:hypothetical protein n=1 Tax=Streptomyces sp. HU2014 TaxID=2939414 RepID=UPI0020102226|nr:hypothetical protein [Streptomyces sp. HU2014]UQI43746.1 hypothetical protein M1P56_04935 [Streptomyces sp. HU2014]